MSKKRMITKSVIFLLILAFILKIFSSLSIAMGYNANPLYNYSSYSIFQEPDNSSSSRTGVITFTQGESGKTCTLTIVQEAGDVYDVFCVNNLRYINFHYNFVGRKHVGCETQ